MKMKGWQKSNSLNDMQINTKGAIMGGQGGWGLLPRLSQVKIEKKDKKF